MLSSILSPIFPLHKKANKLRFISILNIIAICLYFTVSIRFNYFENLENTFWSSPMTGAYVRVGDFLWGGLKGRAPHGSDYRPILYPTILGMFRHISGIVLLEQHLNDLRNDLDSIEKTGALNSGDDKSEMRYEKSDAIEEPAPLRKRADEFEKIILSKRKKITYVLWFMQFLFWF